MKVGDILKALPSLTQKELKQVKATIEFLGVKEPAGEEEHIYQAMLHCLGENHPSFESFTRGRYYKQFKQALPAITGLAHALKAQGAPATLPVLYRAIVGRLLVNMAKLEIAPSVGTITCNLHRVHQTWEEAFPGYLKSGLGYLTVTKRSIGNATKTIPERNGRASETQGA